MDLKKLFANDLKTINNVRSTTSGRKQYPDELRTKILKLVARGTSIASIAKVTSIPKSTIGDWKKEKIRKTGQKFKKVRVLSEPQISLPFVIRKDGWEFSFPSISHALEFIEKMGVKL